MTNVRADVIGLQPSPTVDDTTPQQRLWRPTRSQLAWGTWAAVTITSIALYGIPKQQPMLFLLIGLGLAAATVTNPRSWAKLVRDWLPLYLILALYEELRGRADEWGAAHVYPQINFDRWLFGGVVPTVRLQHLLYTPGHLSGWDYGVFVVYLSHFFVTLIVAAVLWKFDYSRFRRFVFFFVTLTFAAFTTYAIFPAAPPWLASQTHHALAPTYKILDAVWSHIGLHKGAKLLSASSSRLANPVAAIPSVHSAYPVLLMLFFWRSAGRWRWLLPLYPLAMAFTLVYTAEHYVFDIILGWLYATVVYFVGKQALDWWANQRRNGKRAAAVTVNSRGAPSL
jgi:hypothetical protein